MKYIQFIGTQRSGSNLLRVMLNQLPEISAHHPPHILRTFYPLLGHYGDLTRHDNFYALVQDVCSWVNKNPVPWDDFTLEPKQVLQSCERPELTELFRRVYELKAIHDQAEYWCCKSMESVYYINEIEEAGLNPVYIYIYRDGRDVALSFKKAIVGPKHIYHLAKKWSTEQELSLSFINPLSSNRYIMVKYEELITDTNKVMHDICQKLGISFKEEVLDYFHAQESLLTANSGTMWKNLTRPIMHDNFNKFRGELSKDEIVIFESVAGQALNKLGYKTIYWPDTINQFSTEEINKFDLENERLKKLMLENADPEELKHRFPQESLLKEIENRLLIQHE